MKATLPVDYAQHETAWRDLRARGASGWDEDDRAYGRMLAYATPGLPPISAGDAPRILEIGCGAGNFSLLLAERGYAVTGVDIAPTAIEWANGRSRAPGLVVEFCVDDAIGLDSCADESFDYVVDGHCLHCIIGEDRARCLAAVHRVLKFDAVFVVNTMCGEVTDERLRSQFDAEAQVLVRDGRPVRHIGSETSILEEIAQAGFAIDVKLVDPREDAADQDSLVVYARKHDGRRPQPRSSQEAQELRA